MADSLSATLVLDDGSLGSLANHDRAWREASGDWTIVLEDDVEPVPGFLDLASEALRRVPEPAAVCFYVGTGKPRVGQVARAVSQARAVGASWLRMDRALWGPALALPTELVPRMLSFVRWSTKPYDERLSLFLRSRKIPCYYTFPSLVDHADGHSLIAPAPTPRKAHETGRPTWSSDVVVDI